MADIVINPAIGKIDFFSVKGDNVTNTLKLTGNTLLVTGPLSASSISTGGGGAFVTSVQPTSNYLSKFTGNSTIANSLIYDNGTNVGIGTTTSAARLQINSTTSGATLLRTDGTSGTLFTVVDDLSDSLMSVNNSAGLPVLEVFADDRIVGGQYGTNDFVVINNKVGIGTNNPTAKLQVTSSTSTPSAAFLGGNVGIGTTSPAYKLDVSGILASGGSPIAWFSGNYNRIYEPAGNPALYLGNNSDPANYYDNNTHFFRNRGGSSTYAVIEGNGNLGIGTTSVTEAIHVYRAANSIIRLQAGGGNVSGVRMDDASSSGYLLKNRTSDTTNNALAGALYTYTDSNKAFQHIHNGTPLFTILSGGNVGIGTTSPAYKLDVSGTGRVGDVFLITTATTSDARLEIGSGRSGNGNSYLDLIGDATYTDYGLRLIRYDSGANANSRLEHKGTGQLQLFSTEAGSVTISTTSTERMRVDSSGNVGIGTTSPVSKLHVYGVGTFGSSAEYVTLGSYLDSFSSRYSILTTNNHGDFTFGSNLVIDTYHQLKTVNSHPEMSGAAIVLGGNGYSLGTNTIAFFAQSTGTATANTVVSASVAKMVIQQGGNVGIGTTSPSSKLHIYDSTYSFTRCTNTTNAGHYVDIGANQGGQSFLFSYGAYPVLLGTNGNERIRILSDGNVGIGTSSASRKLIVYGDSAFATNSGGLVIASYDGNTANIRPSVANGSILISDDSGATSRGTEFLNGGGIIVESISGFTPLEVKSNSSTLLFVASAGNVGIGTTAPAYKLHVSGSITAAGGSNSRFLSIVTSGTDKYFLDCYGTSGRQIFALYENSSNAYLNSWSTMAFRANQNGGSGGYFTFSGGNIGVGSTPSGILDIQSSNTGDQLVRTWNTDTSGTGKSILRIANSGNNAQGTQLQFTDLNYFVGTIATDRTNGMAFYVGQQATALVSERMRIDINGNVGIGTSSPSFKLSVQGVAQARGGIYVTQASPTNTLILDADSTTLHKIYTNSTVDLSLGTNSSTSQIYLQNGGNVGIGTSSPGGKLEVRTNAASTYIFSGTSTSGYTTSFTMDDTASYIGHDSAARSLTLRTNSTDRLSITGGGNIGIGSSSPACKLDVAGTIRSTSSEIFGFGASDNVSIRAASSVNVMGLYTSNSEKVRLAADGNLGIGTSNPVQKLHVVGAVYGTTYGQFGTAVASGTNASFAVFGSNSAVVGVKLVLDSDVNRNDLVVATTGNIGIGTSTPGAKLNTYASGSNLSVFKVDGGNGTLFEVTDQLSGSLFSVNDVSGLPLLEVFSNNRIVAGKYGSNALVISGSSVGIGTTTPAYKLQVNGSFGATTKSFVIDHPTKEGKKLVYGSLESPYHGIRLTGRNMLIDGECKVQLPDYIYKLARPESVNIQITPIKCGKVIYVDEISVPNNYFVVKYDKSLLESYKNYEFFWDFTATRSDVDELTVEQ
jgi:hypothetical protein